jgi:hypothetical protein
VELVIEDLLSTLENDIDLFETDTHDPPSAPLAIAPLVGNDAPIPGISLKDSDSSSSNEHNTISDEIEKDLVADTAVPASDPSEFDLGQIANVSFTNPGSSKIELGNLNTAINPDSPSSELHEPSLPTLDLDLTMHTEELAPREKALVVQLAPWIAAVAVIGMLSYFFVG